MIINSKIDIHADDYAYSLNTSKDILECIKRGCIDSFSIITNTSFFDDCINMLYKEIPNFPFLPQIYVHINLLEGCFDNNTFPTSWSNLFLSSYGFNRKQKIIDIKKEIKTQINKTIQVLNNCILIAKENNIPYSQKNIRIDSHVHTHVIPIVWESLIEVIDEENYSVEHIRNPKEPIIPFIKHFGLLTSYGLMNMLKNRILMFYSKKVDKYCDEHNIDKMYMWGLMMSGCMDIDRISCIFADINNCARKNDRKMELLFHPGRAYKDEYRKEMNIKFFNTFNTSLNREIEKEAVLIVKDIIK